MGQSNTMYEQEENSQKRRRLIGHIFAISAILLNIYFLCFRDICIALGLVLSLLSFSAYLLATLFYSLSKGRSAGWFVLGLLGPVGLLLVLFGPNLTRTHRFLERQRRSKEAARLAGFPGKTE